MRIHKHWQILLGCALVAGSGIASAVTVELIPPNPGAFEPVHLRVTYPFTPFYQRYLLDTEISMAGNRIQITAKTYPELASRDTSYDVFLGKLPAGTYTAEFSEAEPVVFTVAARGPGNIRDSRPFADINGLWSVPNEPGWGLSVAHGPTTDMVATWFAQDASGKPTWYSIQGTWTASAFAGGDNFSGDVYEVDGPYFGGAFLEGARVRRVGNGSLSVFDSGHLQLNASVDGTRVIKTLSRAKLE